MKQGIVTILLACYNGENFIAEQLDSILDQTCQNWQLIIRDDNSIDKTSRIINEYHLRFPEKIFILEDGLGNVGSVQNFNILLQYAKHAEYIMFCDQDDVWMPGKVALTFTKMQEAEKNYSLSEPLLVYTNFTYADASLNVLESKLKFSATKIQNLQLNHLLAQNPAYGCTMMINKSLATIINYVSPSAENHDYWIALVAATFGKIIYIPESTLLYRQHQQNISGQHDNDSLKKRVQRNIYQKKIFQDVERKFKMAIAFKHQYKELLNAAQSSVINDFINLYKQKSLQVFFRNLKNGVRRQTFSQTVLFYLAVLLRKTQ